MIVTAPTAQPVEPVIALGPFWPDISPQVIRGEQRIDNTITPERLRAALTEAALTTLGALADWKAEQIAAGYLTLDTVPTADAIDSKSQNHHRFQRAIGTLAKALILERTRDFDATGKGERKAEFLTDPIDDLRRDHLHAVSDIIGRPRTTVELI